MSRDGNEFLTLLGLTDDSLENRSDVISSLRIAFVDPNYQAGSSRPKLRFAGEATTGSREYPYLSSYTPTAGDKVIVALFSHSGCILGSIV